MRSWSFLLFVCCWMAMSGELFAQQLVWSQYSFSGGYEYLPDTYEKSGYTLTADLEVHGRRNIFGGMLIGLSGYDGGQSVLVDGFSGPVADRLSDQRTLMMWAAGPGVDWLSNGIDRFYLTLYGGYAVGHYEHAFYEGTVRNTPKESLNGLLGMVRVGYEHQFNRPSVVGFFVQGAYVGDGFCWAIGVRIGFRPNYFQVKKALQDYR